MCSSRSIALVVSCAGIWAFWSVSARADDIRVSSDGSTARRITVKVENGQRNLFGRLFNRQRQGTAATPQAAPAAPTVLLVPADAMEKLVPTQVIPAAPAKVPAKPAGGVKVRIEAGE